MKFENKLKAIQYNSINFHECLNSDLYFYVHLFFYIFFELNENLKRISLEYSLHRIQKSKTLETH